MERAGTLDYPSFAGGDVPLLLPFPIHVFSKALSS